MTYTIYATETARETAAALARGRYQRALLDGDARWSGADLRGRARDYSARYAASRDSLVARMRAAGLTVTYSGGTAQDGPLVATVTD